MQTATMNPPKTGTAKRANPTAAPPRVDAAPRVQAVLDRHHAVARDLGEAKKRQAELAAILPPPPEGVAYHAAPEERRRRVAEEIAVRRAAGLEATEADRLLAALEEAGTIAVKIETLRQAQELTGNELTAARAQAAQELGDDARAYAAPAIRAATLAYFDGWIAVCELEVVRSRLAAAGFATNHASVGLPMQPFTPTAANTLGKMLLEKERDGILTREEANRYRLKLNTR